jgi:hypothetical protein
MEVCAMTTIENGKTEIEPLEFEFAAAAQALEILTCKLQASEHRGRAHGIEVLRTVAAMGHDLDRARKMFDDEVL